MEDHPFVELHDGNGALLHSNDNWHDAPNAAEIQATGLAPTDDHESAVLMTLAPGNYTSHRPRRKSHHRYRRLRSYKLDN